MVIKWLISAGLCEMAHVKPENKTVCKTSFLLYGKRKVLRFVHTSMSSLIPGST